MEISTSAANRFPGGVIAGAAEPTLLQRLGPLNGPKDDRTKDERRKNMNDQNRVLGRRGARDMTEEEIVMVAGGLRTATKCSVTPAGALDGDTFHSECGSPDM